MDEGGEEREEGVVERDNAGIAGDEKDECLLGQYRGRRNGYRRRHSADVSC